MTNQTFSSEAADPSINFIPSSQDNIHEHILPSLLSCKKSLEAPHGATLLHRKEKLSPGFADLKSFFPVDFIGKLYLFSTDAFFPFGSLTPLCLCLQYSGLMFFLSHKVVTSFRSHLPVINNGCGLSHCVQM